jgi:hypothetical protein
LPRSNQLDAAEPINARSDAPLLVEELTAVQSWKVDPALDRLISERFADLHERAVRAELFVSRREPEGRPAEMIVLEEFFSRLPVAANASRLTSNEARSPLLQMDSASSRSPSLAINSRRPEPAPRAN